MSEYTTYQDNETATCEPFKQIAAQNDIDTAKEAIAKGHEKQPDQSHFQTFSANLSVMVLQHKFRSRKASEEFSINESALLHTNKKLAATENSLEILNTDYCRL